MFFVVWFGFFLWFWTITHIYPSHTLRSFNVSLKTPGNGCGSVRLYWGYPNIFQHHTNITRTYKHCSRNKHIISLTQNISLTRNYGHSYDSIIVPISDQKALFLSLDFYNIFILILYCDGIIDLQYFSCSMKI